MRENSVSERLVSTINELSNTEVNEISLLIAIIKKNVVDLIEKNMKKLEDEFIAKCDYYGKSNTDASSEKEEILNGYRNEFNRIASKVEEEYMNLALELQDAQSNQKIAIVNMKKVISSKKKYIESDEYEKFLAKIKELENKRDNCLVKVEFDKIVNYLDNVKDPIEIYNKKIDAYANKYIRYCGLEEACIVKLEKCNEKVENAINSVMQYDVGQLAVVNKKSIFSIFSKILNKISGAKKFEKEYIFKKKENIEKIKVSTDNVLEEIDKEIDEALAVLEVYSLKINQAFSQAV